MMSYVATHVECTDEPCRRRAVAGDPKHVVCMADRLRDLWRVLVVRVGRPWVPWVVADVYLQRLVLRPVPRRLQGHCAFNQLPFFTRASQRDHLELLAVSGAPTQCCLFDNSIVRPSIGMYRNVRTVVVEVLQVPVPSRIVCHNADLCVVVQPELPLDVLHHYALPLCIPAGTTRYTPPTQPDQQRNADRKTAHK
jgi:hypothetical protein